MWLLTLIVFILILGIIILVHEFGHFLWAKKFGIYIYEFSIGMGPLIHTFVGKDNIKYNLRAFPIGGYVSMAGEVLEEEDENIPKDRCLCNKPVWQRIIILAAGVFNNFVLAIVILLAIGIFYGSTTLNATIGDVVENYPAYEAGLKTGDKIVAINNKKVNYWDEVQIILYYKSDKDYTNFTIEHKDGTKENVKITPTVEERDGVETTVYGFGIKQDETHGLWAKVKYAFERFSAIISSMWLTLVGLFTGKISIKALSGPVGIYQVVGTSMAYGFYQVVYLVAYLSVNVGLINILPFPAFDGGRIFFALIEKIKGSPVNPKVENWIHTIGFILLMILIIIITIRDVINLF